MSHHRKLPSGGQPVALLCANFTAGPSTSLEKENPLQKRTREQSRFYRIFCEDTEKRIYVSYRKQTTSHKITFRINSFPLNSWSRSHNVSFQSVPHKTLASAFFLLTGVIRGLPGPAGSIQSRLIKSFI